MIHLISITWTSPMLVSMNGTEINKTQFFPDSWESQEFSILAIDQRPAELFHL